MINCFELIIQGSMEKKRIIIYGGALLIIIILFFAMNSYIKDHRKWVFDTRDTNSLEYAFQVENAVAENDTVLISGWCFKLNEDKNKTDLYVLLRNTHDDSIIRLDTVCLNRRDVNEYFCCDYDYSMSGFEAYAKQSLLSLESNEYEVFLQYGSMNNVLIQTDTYLGSKGIKRFKDSDCQILDNENVLLKEIINEGTLCFGDEEHDAKVIQMDNRVYWLLGPKFKYSENKSSKIICQIWSTQSKQPNTGNLIKDLFALNLDYIPESNYCEDLSTDAIKVYSIDLPTDISILRVLTGYHNKTEGWMWSRSFRPDYKIGQ